MPSFNKCVEIAKKLVKDLFDEIGEDETHGYEHAIRVSNHAYKALEENTLLYGENCNTELENRAIFLAALLHDVDDYKIFPNNTNYENARRILDAIEFPAIDLVLKMISLVSFSKNGIDEYDSSTGLKIPGWMLIPRDADRLEALSYIGIVRACVISIQKNRPLFVFTTPRLITAEEIHAEAFRRFIGKAPWNISLIDCFLSAIIMRARMSSGVNYFTTAAPKAVEPIIQTCILFGKQGTISLEDLMSIVKVDENAGRLLAKYMDKIHG